MLRVKLLGLIFVSSFILNLVWENLHSFLYTHYKGGPITEFILLKATLGDAFLLTAVGIFFVSFPFFQSRLWLMVPIGIVLAVGIEILALSAGRWAYGPLMPLLPLIGVGLTPVLQLATLGYLSFRLSFNISTPN